MSRKDEWKTFALMAAAFLACFFLPVGAVRFDRAVLEGLSLVKWYAREHVILCLVPAFFIAGAIAVFVKKESVIRYFGPRANKALAYGVASVSGTILAVCSCTVLPIFAGIYKRGAGIGPATTFLYSGPAINVLAVILTARVLGIELGIARALGAIVFSVVIGLLMHAFFGREGAGDGEFVAEAIPGDGRPLWKTAVYFASMVGVLVFANWGRPAEAAGIWHAVYESKWIITGAFAVGLAGMLGRWFGLRWPGLIGGVVVVVALGFLFPRYPMVSFAAGIVGLSILVGRQSGELGDWFESSWSFAKQILPLLLFGVFVAGVLFGRPGGVGLVPSEWVGRAVGGNSLGANLFASVAGAFMYFATLTEVPILQGLIGSGMGKGPALALLLAGPALSLPNMLVIGGVIGFRKTGAYVVLVVSMATISGILYGAFFG